MTTTPEQSRRLWELGVEKESYFMWRVHSGEPVLWRFVRTQPVMDVRFYPAYSAEELVAMLEGSYRIAVCGDKSIRIGSDCYTDTFEALTITQALGNKLIHDVENGIVSLEEINK